MTEEDRQHFAELMVKIKFLEESIGKMDGLITDIHSLAVDLTSLVGKIEIIDNNQKRVEDDFKTYDTQIEKRFESIEVRIEKLEDVPAKRWEQVVVAVLGLVIAYLMGFVLK